MNGRTGARRATKRTHHCDRFARRVWWRRFSAVWEQKPAFPSVPSCSGSKDCGLARRVAVKAELEARRDNASYGPGAHLAGHRPEGSRAGTALGRGGRGTAREPHAIHKPIVALCFDSTVRRAYSAGV